ncbi:MAG TPA: DUF2339 domain-containing protein, partial [Longimicrobium sp.]|nr:DUF2339 domain-containing protein [Longimicrobium sp.]
MSTRDDDASMRARVERLERQVEELQRQLAASSAARPRDPAASPRAILGANGRPHARRERVFPRVRWESELWLNRLGIGMVLLGVALLFRYSIEQGWLTPAVRVGFGAAT